MQKPNNKGFSILQILLVLTIVGVICGVGVYVIGYQKQPKLKVDSAKGSQSDTSTTIPSDWKAYTNERTGISFVLPSSFEVVDNQLSSTTITQDGQEIETTKIARYAEFFVKPSSRTTQDIYNNAETDKPGKSLELAVFASVDKPQDYKNSTAGEFVNLDPEDKYSTLNNKDGFTYLLLTQGKRWGNYMYILQCNQENLCRSTMERKHRFKYVYVYVSALENWRHGNNPIDTTSPDYSTMQKIIQSMKF